MTISKILILFYVGLPYNTKNVLSHDLNLQNLLRSGFIIKTSLKNDATYTHILPSVNKTITKVLDGEKIIWEAKSREVASDVTVIKSPGSEESLMYIVILDGNGHDIKYYVDVGGLFKEADHPSFYSKLLHIIKLHEIDDRRVEEVDGQIKYNEENNNKVELFTTNSEEYTPEQDLTMYDTPPFLETRRKSLNKPVNYGCKPRDKECSTERRILDIMDPEKNTRIVFEYEYNDGIPTLTVSAMKHKKVTFLYQGENLIWQGSNKERLVDLTAYAHYGEYRLIELCCSDKSETYVKYYKKNIDKWEEINVNNYEETFKEMKSKIIIIGNVSLNILDPKEGQFYSKAESEENYDSVTYFPLTGYHLTQVGEGEKLIWSSTNTRCLAAVVILEEDTVRLLKLEILNKNEETKLLFYKKHRGKYIEINEEQYDQLLDNPSDDFGEDQFVSQNSRRFKGNLFQEIQDKLSRQLRKIMEPIRGDDHSSLVGGYNEELQLLGKTSACVSEDRYRGVTYKTFEPQKGKVYNVVKLGQTVVWESTGEQYTDFVRIFYPGSKPRLGLLRLNDDTVSKPYDIYFVLFEGSWAVVTFDYFMEVFDEYSTKEAQQKTGNNL